MGNQIKTLQFMSLAQISVCIATHKRIRGLQKLLNSLVDQQQAPSFEVIVVDNDEAKSAEAVALQFRDKLPLTYLVEPIRGIARTRNLAVAASQSPFLAFIDDDEWAVPRWLAEFDCAHSRTNADAVIGPVEVEFDSEVSELVRNCGLFDRAPLTDGDPVPWYYTRTSNAYIRRDALPEHHAPFSTRFDLSGGEDSHLFKRMIDSGSRVVACANAVVFEHRPVTRANFAWILRRALRNGVTFAELNWHCMPTAMRLRCGLKSAYVGCTEWVLAGGDWKHDRRKAGQHVVAGAAEVGKMLYALGIQINEYRRHP